MNTTGKYMRMNETKIQQKENDNIICERYHSKPTARRQDGRCVLRYPLKEDRALGSSLPGARARFPTLKKNFKKITD
jgi:hypothetical protein